MKAEQAKILSAKAIKDTANPIIFIIETKIKNRISNAHFDTYYSLKGISDIVIEYIKQYFLALGYTVGFENENLVISWD